MFVETLSKEMIADGKELIERLDKAQWVINASLWFYLPDLNIWRLIIATPEIRIQGPAKLYKKIQSVISKMQEDKKIALGNISVVDTNDSLILLLRKAIKTGRAISGIRFSKNAINGVFIEDAYIYRLT